MATITQRNPVREEVASVSTDGPDKYYAHKVNALWKVNNLLKKYGFELDEQRVISLEGDEGRANLPITVIVPGGLSCDCCGGPVETVDNQLVYVWYKMPSGRYEITCYIS